jgi:regulatory protein
MGGDGEITAAEVEQAAVRLLANREHSRAELCRKLGRRFPDALLHQVLDSLEQRGLLSDARFAEQYIESRMLRGYGPVRIAHELRERGVSEAEAGLAMEQADIDWHELLQQVSRRKFGDSAPKDYKESAKRARFLQYRGFPADWIRELFRAE